MSTISANEGIRAGAGSSTQHRLIQETGSIVIRFVGDSGDGMQLTGGECGGPGRLDSHRGGIS